MILLSREDDTADFIQKHKKLVSVESRERKTSIIVAKRQLSKEDRPSDGKAVDRQPPIVIL